MIFLCWTCVTAETNVLQIPFTHRTIYYIRKVSRFPTYDPIFLNIVRDPNLETLLAPNQAWRRMSQIIQQRIHVVS